MKFIRGERYVRVGKNTLVTNQIIDLFH
jgi:hypothetical protein